MSARRRARVPGWRTTIGRPVPLYPARPRPGLLASARSRGQAKRSRPSRRELARAARGCHRKAVSLSSADPLRRGDSVQCARGRETKGRSRRRCQRTFTHVPSPRPQADSGSSPKESKNVTETHAQARSPSAPTHEFPLRSWSLLARSPSRPVDVAMVHA